VSNSKC